MTEQASAVIVGGGIMGACLAFSLAGQGMRDVVLIERSTLASGASGKTGALLRLHYSNEPEARLAQLGHEVYANWGEIIGGDCGFVRSGLVVTVETRGKCADNVERMRRNIALQNRLGIHSELITAEQLLELQPFLNVDDLDLAAYEPESGYVDAVAATHAMATAAASRGVTTTEACAVTSLIVTGNRVTGVETPTSRIHAEIVVLATGPWTPSLVAPLGVEIPIEPLRVQVAILVRPSALPAHGMAASVDTVAGVFYRDWGPYRTMVGVGGGEFHDVVAADAWEPRTNSDFPAAATERIGRRIPAMRDAAFLSGHAGLYDMTPDGHPIIGHVPGVGGLYVAAGFSGAGFKKGPAVGQCLAELIWHGSSRTVDLAPFSLDRFATDAWLQPWSDNEYLLSSDFGHGF
jgi:sarcosine oxidase subunit beta